MGSGSDSDDGCAHPPLHPPCAKIAALRPSPRRLRLTSCCPLFRRTSPTATCLSCGTEITGSIFMFNDARYCCERHRLTAVYAHMEARSQKKRGSFNSNPANGSLPERPLQQRAGERVFYTWV